MLGYIVQVHRHLYHTRWYSIVSGTGVRTEVQALCWLNKNARQAHLALFVEVLGRTKCERLLQVTRPL